MVVILTPDEIRRMRKREKENRWRWWQRQVRAEARRQMAERIAARRRGLGAA